MREAFRLFNEGRHLKVKVGTRVYENVLIKSLDSGSASASTVTLVLPTPIGEPTRFGTWPLDQVEVLA
jgi:hypothetical protein